MMDEDTKGILAVLITVIMGIALATVFCGAYYYTRKMSISNFQVTIKDLSDEQKCIHICGFEWHGYFENYKFCMEKCDRISERTLSQSSG